MGRIHPLRLGITCSALALIVCVIWFAATDQAAELRRRAFVARDESFASARAAEKGVSLWEMRRLANAACAASASPNPNDGKAAPPTSGTLDLFQQDRQIASRPSIEECVNNYIYGDNTWTEPTFDLFKLWIEAVVTIVFISVAAGAAMAAIFQGGLWGLKSWWSWLRTD
ncbi:MAG: hypothetical protein ABSA66_04040 [Roseiarcus sp.]|jgi:hypothetical protein